LTAHIAVNAPGTTGTASAAAPYLSCP
jgi:hypothetical protein